MLFQQDIFISSFLIKQQIYLNLIYYILLFILNQQELLEPYQSQLEQLMDK